jgi:Uncharacterized protein conserved in bacteria (DUF2188)
MRTIVHIPPYGHGMWQIKLGNESKYHSVYGDKYTAAETGRALAKSRSPATLVVHQEDGTVEYEFTYVGDPVPPPS